MATPTNALVEAKHTSPTKLQRLADKLSAMTDLKNTAGSACPQHEPFHSSSPIKSDPVWENGIRDYIAQSVPEWNEIESPDLIKSVYIAGVRNAEILTSLAALCLPDSQAAIYKYDHHVLTLAKCFSTPSPVPMRRISKLAVLRTLITMRSPLEAGWQLKEDVLEDTLKFITTRSFDWPFEKHLDEILLWELRATTLNEIEMRSERVAGCISKQAVMVKRGLEISTDVLNAGIEGAGARLKEVLPQNEQRKHSEANQSILHYSERAKRATDNARLASRQAVVKIQSTSTQGIKTVATKINNDGRVERFIPDEGRRRALGDIGKIGVASVGAGWLVADTLIESTGQVYKKTATVAADVVEHKYGPHAGTLVRNASDTAGNIAKTLSHVALFHKGRAMTKSVAKATGKAHLLEINEKCLLDDFISESSSSSDESDLFADATGDIFDGEAKSVVALDSASEVGSKATPSREHSVLDIDAKSEVFVLQDGAASDFDFGTTIDLSPSELDSCLPDEITGATEGQSDLFSDITVEPMYERRPGYLPKVNQRSSTSNIFRNLNDEREQDFLNNVGTLETCAKPLKSLPDEENSLDKTACTLDETYLTYDDSEDCRAQALLQAPDPEDVTSEVSGFEQHYEALGAGSIVSTAVPETEAVHRIPANGGYVDLKAQLQESPRRRYFKW